MERPILAVVGAYGGQIAKKIARRYVGFKISVFIALSEHAHRAYLDSVDYADMRSRVS